MDVRRLGVTWFPESWRFRWSALRGSEDSSGLRRGLANSLFRTNQGAYRTPKTIAKYDAATRSKCSCRISNGIRL